MLLSFMRTEKQPWDLAMGWGEGGMELTNELNREWRMKN